MEKREDEQAQSSNIENHGLSSELDSVEAYQTSATKSKKTKKKRDKPDGRRSNRLVPGTSGDFADDDTEDDAAKAALESCSKTGAVKSKKKSKSYRRKDRPIQPTSGADSDDTGDVAGESTASQIKTTPTKSKKKNKKKKKKSTKQKKIRTASGAIVYEASVAGPEVRPEDPTNRDAETAGETFEAPSSTLSAEPDTATDDKSEAPPPNLMYVDRQEAGPSHESSELRKRRSDEFRDVSPTKRSKDSAKPSAAGAESSTTEQPADSTDDDTPADTMSSAQLRTSRTYPPTAETLNFPSRTPLIYSTSGATRKIAQGTTTQNSGSPQPSTSCLDHAVSSTTVGYGPESSDCHNAFYDRPGNDSPAFSLSGQDSGHVSENSRGSLEQTSRPRTPGWDFSNSNSPRGAPASTRSSSRASASSDMATSTASIPLSVPRTPGSYRTRSSGQPSLRSNTSDDASMPSESPDVYMSSNSRDADSMSSVTPDSMSSATPDAVSMRSNTPDAASVRSVSPNGSTRGESADVSECSGVAGKASLHLGNPFGSAKNSDSSYGSSDTDSSSSGTLDSSSSSTETATNISSRSATPEKGSSESKTPEKGSSPSKAPEKGRYYY